jgi:hypothetical protein
MTSENIRSEEVAELSFIQLHLKSRIGKMKIAGKFS